MAPMRLGLASRVVSIVSTAVVAEHVGVGQLEHRGQLLGRGRPMVR